MKYSERIERELCLGDTLRRNRRVFLQGASSSMAGAALASLLADQVHAAKNSTGLDGLPHYQPKAKRVIYLFQSGAPSQMDLFDPKPAMESHRGEDLPESIRRGQRLTTMTSGQKNFPVAPSMFKFAQHGDSGMWMSELLPNMSKLADRWTMIRSMHTEAINHDPAITFVRQGRNWQAVPASALGSATVSAARTKTYLLISC